MTIDEEKYKKTPPRIQAKKEQYMALYKIANGRFANTIGLFDYMPRFLWGNAKRKSKPNKTLPHIIKRFAYDGQEYKVEVVPAQFQNHETGDRVQYLPGPQEELVEKAIMRLVQKRRAIFDPEGYCTVYFSFQDLKREMKHIGHTLSTQQIELSLSIITRSIIILTGPDRDGIIVETTTSAITSMGLLTREQYCGGGAHKIGYISLNSYSSDEIALGNYRMFDFIRHVDIKSPLARWLHLRLVNNFTYSGPGKIYTITARRIMDESCMPEYKRLRDSFLYIDNAWDELIEQQIVKEIDRIYDTEGRKIMNVIYRITPTWEFSRAQKKANGTKKMIVNNLEGDPKKLT